MKTVVAVGSKFTIAPHDSAPIFDTDAEALDWLISFNRKREINPEDWDRWQAKHHVPVDSEPVPVAH